MSFSHDTIAELDLLLIFDLKNSQAGIKLHKGAKPEAINAARRLFEKGFISQEDGGYLTNLGFVAAEHAQALFTCLNAPAPGNN